MVDSGDDKIEVLFIGGYGRSGSTLLDRTFGRMNGACSVGEVRHSWLRSFKEDQLCGCGVPFSRCEFWNDVLSVLEKDHGKSFLTKGIEQGKVACRWRRLPGLLFRKSPPPDLLGFLEFLEAFYRAVVRVSGAAVVVDSSKDPVHGFLLAMCPGLQVKMLHLVRDPRAVAFSWKRKKQQPEVHWEKAMMPRFGTLRSVSAWVVRNLVTHILRNKVRKSNLVRYEDFSSSPRTELDKIIKALDLQLSSDGLFNEMGMITYEKDHTLAGNPFRFEIGAQRIELDDEWITKMPFPSLLVISVCSFPLLLHYGYSLIWNPKN